MASHIEREDKYDVESGFDLPAALELALVDGRSASIVEHDIDNVYWDTGDHALRAFGATLRRRQGGADDGWHLKLPRPDGARDELHSADPSAEAPPEDLVTRVAGLVRGRPLVQVARLREHRISYLVADAEGRDLVEIDDGQVRATVMGADAATAIEWREVEIEETGEDGSSGEEQATGRDSASGEEQAAGRDSASGEVRVALGEQLRSAGARRSEYASKLEHALTAAGSGPAEDAATAASGNPLVTYLRTQYAALVAGDVDLRSGSASVHRTRVASRRMRSTLRSYGSLFVEEDVEGLEEELRWYAQVLGDVREQEVLGARLVQQVHELPVELVMGPVVAIIEQDVSGASAGARDALAEAMASPRYFALLEAVERLAAKPPLRKRPRRSRLEAAAARAERTAMKRLRRALGPDGTDEQLHSARKAAKRARYAAEVLASDSRKHARAVSRFEALQEILGDHQDAVVASEVVRRLGAGSAARPDWNGFTFGLLLSRQHQVAGEARRDARRWLRHGGR